MAISERGVNIGVALCLSIFLHGTGLLFANVASSWLTVVPSKLQPGAEWRLNAVLQPGLRPLAGKVDDPVLPERLDFPENSRRDERPIVSGPLVEGGASVSSEVGSGGRAVLGEYLPRSALSIPPAPLREIVVPWPGELVLSERHVAIFTLHIDELGIVREVIPDAKTSLPMVDEAVRKAFLGASFRPGQIGGRPVRSRVRIEVVFESTTPDLPMPAVVDGRKEL